VKTSASKLLIPLAFGSILGGTCTLIGTSTNLASSGYISAAGYEPIRMFELLPMGIILFLAGTVFMYIVGYGMLPDRSGQTFIEAYKLRRYVSDIVILENSPLIGQVVYSNDLHKMKFQILNVIRDNQSVYSYLTQYNKPYTLFRLFNWGRILPSREHVNFRVGDKLVVEGKVEDLLKIKETEGIEIYADTIQFKENSKKNLHFAEVIIPSGSRFIGQKVRKAEFSRRMGFAVVAINRHGDTVQVEIGDVEMQLGDILLLQGDQVAIQELRTSPHLTLTQQFMPLLYKKVKGSVILFLFIAAIFLGSLGIIPLSVGLLTAAIGAVLVKAITPEKAYEYIEWELVILIGGMTAFGLAMEKSGAANLMASVVGEHLAPGGELVVMGAFIIITIILTQAMSNAAAALVIIPIAIKSAIELGVDPRAFAIAVMIAASVSLITPFEPSCIIVYGPGKYRFVDFLKSGAGVTIISVILMMIFIPIFWPLK
jgi:di/tricarboxylate transporter